MCDIFCVKMIILGATTATAVVGLVLPAWISKHEKATAVGMLTSGGILLAASLCHLLADASTEAAKAAPDKFPWAQCAFGVGYLFIQSIESVSASALRAVKRAQGGLTSINETSNLLEQQQGAWCTQPHMPEAVPGDDGGRTMLKLIQQTGTAGVILCGRAPCAARRPCLLLLTRLLYCRAGHFAFADGALAD
jgi:hypothetical protein